jgi:hypothetical protein|tara:strand:+ start:5422 stop:7137 length:1716 start_codon:yes stop_codon:yes gene_type:complete
MTGGLLNIVAQGENNHILTGNPSKSFFKGGYAKHTNFGIQKFRLDPEYNNSLNTYQKSSISFKIERYGDLLMDLYLCVKIPDIYSPIVKLEHDDPNKSFNSYEFKWIKNLGSQIIDTVEYELNGILINKYHGDYLQCMIERDFDVNKKKIYDIMSGNIDELYDPKSHNNGKYPNYFFEKKNRPNEFGIPSIHGRLLYIPLNNWFSMTSKQAFPLIACQYCELKVKFTLKAIKDLYVIKNLFIGNNNDISLNEYSAPMIADERNYFKRFTNIYTDASFIDISNNNNTINRYYNNIADTNNNDIHLIGKYVFLDEDERTLFLQDDKEYLIKNVKRIENILPNNNSGRIEFDSNGLVSKWMWYFQRDDVDFRNEWSNYTTYKYENKVPKDIIDIKTHIEGIINTSISEFSLNEGFYSTNSIDNFSETNEKNFLDKLAIIFNGKYREELFDADIYNYIEKYNSQGNFKDGLYYYNFGVNNEYSYTHPDGAINTNYFKTIEFEYSIKNRVSGQSVVPFNEQSLRESTICDEDGNIVSYSNKTQADLGLYRIKMVIFEEKYNILKFSGGWSELKYTY